MQKRFLQRMFAGMLGVSFVASAQHACAFTPIEMGNRNGLNGYRIDGLPNSRLGGSVAGLGDVNGDGFDDYIVGMPYVSFNNVSYSGSAFVVFGSAGPAPSHFEPASIGSLNGTNGFRIEGADAGDYLGIRVGHAGDINGDGFDDILVGAPYSAVHGVFTGAAFVIFGKESFPEILNVNALDGTNGFRMNGGFFNDGAGQGLSGVGDINSDGRDDIIVGAPGVDIGGVGTPGAAYLIFGKSQFTTSTIELADVDGTNGIRIVGHEDGDEFGFRAGAAGDFNNDGIDDFMISARGANSNGAPNSGSTYLVFGDDQFTTQTFEIGSLNAVSGMVINGPAANCNLGTSVAPAGDVNGDGIDDIIIGSPYTNNISGASYVVFGTGTTSATLVVSELNGTNGFELTGEEFGAVAGRSVSGAGDMNGDGLADVIIGAPNSTSNGSDAGAVYAVFGQDSFTTGSYSLSGLDGVEVIKYNGVIDRRVGTWVSGVGDFNQDGYSDFIAGAPKQDSAYLVFGSVPVTTAKLKVTLQFAKVDSDVISLKGTLPVVPDFDPAGKKVVVDVGGVIHSFDLDEKGSAKTLTESLKLKAKPSKVAGAPAVASLKLSLKKGSFADNLVDEGLQNITTSNTPVELLVTVTISDTSYRKLVPQTYTAKQGSSGKTK